MPPCPKLAVLMSPAVWFCRVVLHPASPNVVSFCGHARDNLETGSRMVVLPGYKRYEKLQTACVTQ